MTRDDNPENTIPASSLMSHATDHATANESWHNLTRRHHRKLDRAVEITVPPLPSAQPCVSAPLRWNRRASLSVITVHTDSKKIATSETFGRGAATARDTPGATVATCAPTSSGA